jgi:CRISPR/Cas system-associated exonuclease Cas4 (RecB family)
VIRIEKRILSPTAINTYLACPRKYYLRYIRKLPGKPSIHLIRGAIVHKTLHEFHVNGSRNDPWQDPKENRKALISIFQRLWQKEKNVLDSLGLSKELLWDYYLDSTDMLNNYAHWFANQRAPPVVDSTELKIFSNNLRIMGIIDAVTINDNGTFLIDYKTSKDFSITEDIMRQAILYCLLYQDRYEEIPTAVYIHFLKDPGDPVALFIDDAQLEYGKVLIDSTHEKTKARDETDYPCTCGGYCMRDFIDQG